jgi:hypothetical protein
VFDPLNKACAYNYMILGVYMNMYIALSSSKYLK